MIAKILFENGHRHVSADDLHFLAISRRVAVAQATIYNTLRQFKDAGLLREVMVGPGRSYFDTNLSPHHHYFIEEEGRLIDVPQDGAEVNILDTPPGTMLERVDLVVRIRSIKP
jgi:Fur family iron response transcriptional regulator